MKLDKRKNYYLTIDTETTNTIENPIVFDIGGCVYDKRGNTYETFSFVIYDTFVLMRDLTNCAFYASKLPQYEQDIKNGTRKLVNYSTAKKHIEKICKKYHIKAIIAHNMPFDYRACTGTQRYLTKSKYRFFFPYGIELWDTLKMATDTICKQKTYIRFCEENGYLKSNGTPRATAEILYRYISGNNDFIESHTALEDTEIEKEIFLKCLRQHKKMRKNPWN